MVALFRDRGTQADLDRRRCRRAVLIVTGTALNVGYTARANDSLELDLEIPGLAMLENVNKAK